MARNDYSGQTLDNGRYELHRLVAKGGMGAVYLGKHTLVGRKVAVKFLHSEFTEDRDVIERFYREARASAAIGHKNIIDILDVGVSDLGDPYIVMEYLEGESLASLLDRVGPLDLAVACRIMEPVLLALHAAHNKGIVHRDLKPDNIFLVYQADEPPSVKVIDFGISKVLRHGHYKTTLTEAGSLLGTPAYMSPEQARGDPEIDARADLYTIGVIFYEMLAGALPFDDDSHAKLLIDLLITEPRSPIDVNPNFPPEAVPIIDNLLTKDPVDRLQNASELLEKLREFDCFDKGNEIFSELAKDVENYSFARGDVGKEIGLESNTKSPVAADILAKVAKQRALTPIGSDGEQAMGNGLGEPSRSGAPAPAPRRNPAPWINMLAAVGLMIVGAVLFALFTRVEENETPTQPEQDTAPESELQTESDSVLVTVDGAPEGARVYYDNTLYEENPFRVRKETSVIPLRVEANGYRTFKMIMIPI